MSSRYDEAAANRAWVNRHLHECRSDDCTFCSDVAEDRARERDIA